jgi:hypothetical protein
MPIAAPVLATAGCGTAANAPVQVPPFKFDPALVHRFAQRPPAPQPSLPPPPACPADTFWDGFSCAHARATCGAWNGTSCAPAAVDARTEALTRAEYGAIDADARTICPEDDPTKQVYAGTVDEVTKAAGAALGRAQEIERRFDQLREKNPSPRWRAATFARAGSLYDCIWTSFSKASPTLFTPQQMANLQQSQNRMQQLQQAGWPPQPNAVQMATQRVQELWSRTRGGYLTALGQRMVNGYLTAAILSRRYGLEGYSFLRASERLRAIANDRDMAFWVYELSDPTDPEPDPIKRRRLYYLPDSFDRFR